MVWTGQNEPEVSPSVSAALIATSPEGADTASLQQQRQERSYFVRLGSLSERLRNHAYEHSLGKLCNVRQSAQDALQQLTHVLSLVSILVQPRLGPLPAAPQFELS